MSSYRSKKINDGKFNEPGLVTLCQVVGGFAIVFGGLGTVGAIIGAFSQPAAPDSGSVFAISISILLSSLFWFVAAQVIRSLAQIAHNTGAK